MKRIISVLLAVILLCGMGAMGASAISDAEKVQIELLIDEFVRADDYVYFEGDGQTTGVLKSGVDVAAFNRAVGAMELDEDTITPSLLWNKLIALFDECFTAEFAAHMKANMEFSILVNLVGDAGYSAQEISEAIGSDFDVSPLYYYFSVDKRNDATAQLVNAISALEEEFGISVEYADGDWWDNLPDWMPGWLQSVVKFLLKYIFFGWIWMN